MNSDSTKESVDDSRSPLARVEMVSGAGRMRVNRWFQVLCVATATASVVILAFLLISIIGEGSPALSWTLLTGTPEPDPSEAGMWPALMGTVWVCSICALITLPLGIGTAILLEEFKPR
jgi:phosphate transport system permease protein